MTQGEGLILSEVHMLKAMCWTIIAILNEGYDGTLHNVLGYVCLFLTISCAIRAAMLWRQYG